MKKGMIFLMFILLATFVSAADFEVERVKVYIEDERYSQADEDGGDVDVNKDDTVDFVITLMNNFENQTRAKIKMRIDDIDDGDDIAKDLNWFEIDGEDDKSKTLSFVVPDEAQYDEYDVDITITYEDLDDNEHELYLDYNIVVEEYEEPYEEINLKSSFDNLTKVSSQMISDLATCFGYIDSNKNMTNGYSVCTEERARYKTDSENCDSEFESMKRTKDDVIEDKNNEILELNRDVEDKDREIKTLTDQKSSMKTISECNQMAQNLADEEKKKSSNNTLLIIGGGAVAFFLWQKKKKGDSVADNVEYYE